MLYWVVTIAVIISVVINIYNRHQRNAKEAIATSKVDQRKYLDTNIRPFGEHYMILVNPVAGDNRGKWIYEQVLLPMLDSANIEHTTFTTTHAGHATEIISKVPAIINHYHAILVISGDGMFHEVINGLLSREDISVDNIADIPLGLIPGGTSNGLVSTICEEAYGDIYDVCFDIIYGNPHPMDMIEAVISNGDSSVNMYDMMSLNWAQVASFNDIAERKLRIKGLPLFIRYTGTAAYIILLNNSYQGKLSFLPATPEPNSKWDYYVDPSKFTPSKHRNGWMDYDSEDFIMFTVQNIARAGDDFILSPACGINDGKLDIVIIKSPTDRISSAKCFLGFETGDHINQDCVDIIPAKEFELTFENGSLDFSGEDVTFQGSSVYAHAIHNGVSMLRGGFAHSKVL
eukprot:TRINITY_DN8460_c0_g1_i1.p1 TRINITY_DN8460_c0_g1~~TRINITY_DN8460_c0_g1_i1.p1  ORF type:complete len:402 (+),score=70.37 TRINITY_DN8460_c0_g1_i1:20-1225(+)